MGGAAQSGLQDDHATQMKVHAGLIPAVENAMGDAFRPQDF